MFSEKLEIIKDNVLLQYRNLFKIIDEKSETNTSKSLTAANTAAPVPLSPAPNTTILFSTVLS